MGIQYAEVLHFSSYILKFRLQNHNLCKLSFAIG